MKKTRFVVFLCIINVLFMGCTSVAPVFYANNSNIDYEIRGRVRVEADTRIGHGGFSDLLDAAKKEYPTCDFVVDVTVDRKTTSLFNYSVDTYILQGTAVKYKHK